MVRRNRGVNLSPKPKNRTPKSERQAQVAKHQKQQQYNAAAASIGKDPQTPSAEPVKRSTGQSANPSRAAYVPEYPSFSLERPKLPENYRVQTEELTVICWKWSQSKYRSKFGPHQVHKLRNMLERNLQIPHRFVCITDDARGLDVETIPLWEFPEVNVRQGKPNCYRRLRVFDKDAKDWLGKRIMSIDLDVVITGDITEIVDRPDEEFIIWGDTAKNTAYNGGFWLMDAGARSQVWEQFTPDAPSITASQKMVGSDQAWISYMLGPNERKWTTQDGVYSFRNHVSRKQAKGRTAPVNGLADDARIVFFHGHYDPWDTKIQRQHPWIRHFYY